MRSRRAGLPNAIRVRKRGYSLLMYVSRMTRAENLKSFLGNHFSRQFMTPWSLWAENIFWFFEIHKFSIPVSKSPPHPRYTILESRSPFCNTISDGRPPLFNMSSEAGRQPSMYVSRMTRPKIFKVENFKSFFGNHFSPQFMSPWSFALWAENIFPTFEVWTYPSIYDFGLEGSSL